MTTESDESEKNTKNSRIRTGYNIDDAKWFATTSLGIMLISYIGMVNSGISYFGLSFDIGSFLGLGPLLLSESMIMIPVHFVISMLFFAGGIEWYVLCRHCPCYEHSGAEHDDKGKFYCLANWGSPKIFEYDPSPISARGKVVFLVWGIGFAFLFQVLYLWDRLDWLMAYLVLTAVFLVTLRHWACSSCPNITCVLNCVPEKNKVAFIEKR